MPYQIDKRYSYHSEARYAGYVRVGGDTYHFHWASFKGILYAVESLPAKPKQNTLTCYATHEVLKIIQNAAQDEEVVVIPSILPYWERYRPNEVEALSKVSYHTTEPPRAEKTHFRKYTRSPQTTPAQSLAHRVKMLNTFINDMEKKGIKWRDIKYARATLAKLETMLAAMLEESNSKDELK
jgi:hypothetical protein